MIKPVGLAPELQKEVLGNFYLSTSKLLREKNYAALMAVILDPSFDKPDCYFRETLIESLMMAFRNKKNIDVIETFLAYLQESGLSVSQRSNRLNLVVLAITKVGIPDDDKQRVVSILQKVCADIRNHDEVVQVEIELLKSS